MTTANNIGFQSRIAMIWSQWWRLSSAWLVVLLTMWLLPGDLLNEWVGGPSKREVVEMFPWLVFPPTSALILMLIFFRRDTASAQESQVHVSRMQMTAIIGLLFCAFVALMIVFEMTPGPRMKALFWSLLSAGRE